MNKLTSTFLLFSVLLALPSFISQSVLAGTYTDNLSKCLVSKATSNDKTILITWLFSAIALNPEISEMANISPTQRTKINGDMAKLFETLLTKTCKSEAQLALKFEGADFIGKSFGTLGEVAGQELFTNPKVDRALDETVKLIDIEKLKSLFNAAK